MIHNINNKSKLHSGEKEKIIMATYKVLINTDNFTHFPCSKKNWEPGTINGFYDGY